LNKVLSCVFSLAVSSRSIVCSVALWSRWSLAKAEHERPNEGRDLELAVTFDHAEFLGVLFEELRGKQCSGPTHNSR